MTMEVFERLESEVRGYCRAFPVVFDTAAGAILTAEDVRRYVDFFAGAGVLNYGHDHPALREPLLEYLQRGGVIHGLDMATTAKRRFLETFEEHILKPRGMEYRLQFPSPTGCNAVEAAIKLARKVTGRTRVVAFTNAFHGMSLGALALTGNAAKRAGAGVPLDNCVSMPYDGWLGPDIDTVDILERYLEDSSSGLDAPAAVIVETVQGEGGVNVASVPWLKRLEELTKKHGALFVVDDIQAGIGRTGTFFSFEAMGLEPDLVCLSKSLSGNGLPFSVVLIRPEVDQWAPGEHIGTFRGNNLAFVTATAALEAFWRDDAFTRDVTEKASLLRGALEKMAARHADAGVTVRGRGMLMGLHIPAPGVARKVSARAFEKGLVMVTSGTGDSVAKLLPPCVIEPEVLDEGLEMLARSLDEVMKES